MQSEILVDGLRYVSTKDAARNAGVTADYVSRLCRTNLVAARREDNQWWVSEESLKAFLADQAYRKDEWRREQSTKRKAERQEAIAAQATPPADEPQRHPAITIVAPHAALREASEKHY